MTLIDLAFNEEFDAYIGPDGDFATVTGRQAFEQGLLFILTAYFFEVIGEFGRRNIRQKIELRAQRLVYESEFVDEVEFVEVKFSEENVGGVDVTIHYVTDEQYNFTLTE